MNCVPIFCGKRYNWALLLKSGIEALQVRRPHMIGVLEIVLSIVPYT